MNTQWSRSSERQTRIILVRHAAHPDLGIRLTGRAPGADLSEEGRRQASSLAAYLSSDRVTAIHASPRERAQQTAEAIGLTTGAPVTVADALDEIEFGEWTGARYDALDGTPAWDAWNRQRGSSRAPGGESMTEATERIAEHVFRLAREQAGTCIALVTHCDMIRGLVARCLGLPLDNLLRFEIAPASVSRIEAGSWGARLVSLNEPAGAVERP